MATFTRPRKGTRPAVLLEVAAADFHRTEFTLEEATVQAWHRDRRLWGLRGFEDRYPDSKVVALVLFRLARKYGDLVESVRPGTYRLTPAGARAA